MTHAENVFLDMCCEYIRRVTSDLGNSTAALWRSPEGRAVIAEALGELGALADVCCSISTPFIERYLFTQKKVLLARATQQHSARQVRAEHALCTAVMAHLHAASPEEQHVLVATLLRARGRGATHTRELLRELRWPETLIREHLLALGLNHDE